MPGHHVIVFAHHACKCCQTTRSGPSIRLRQKCITVHVCLSICFCVHVCVCVCVSHSRWCLQDITNLKDFFEVNLELTKPGSPIAIHDVEEAIVSRGHILPPAMISQCKITHSLIGEGSVLRVRLAPLDHNRPYHINCVTHYAPVPDHTRPYHITAALTALLSISQDTNVPIISQHHSQCSCQCP